jgi:hypothetical protein
MVGRSLQVHLIDQRLTSDQININESAPLSLVKGLKLYNFTMTAALAITTNLLFIL